MNLVDSIAPKIKLKNNNSPPWIDSEVIHLSNIKETARRKAKREKTPASEERYKNLNNRLKNLLEAKYRNYINNSAELISSNPKRFWGIVKAKTKNRSLPETMRNGISESSTAIDKANMLNNYFQSVFTQPCPNDELPNIETTVNPSLSLLQLSVAEVRLTLENLNPNKAYGPDGLPTRILKECAATLAPSLTILFNRSLCVGEVPDQWKLANVVPIFKKGEKDDVSNYRPVSLLSVTSKVLERCIFNQIYPFIGAAIYPLQHGFMKGKSTVTQLLEVYYEVNKIMDNSGQVDMIFLDFAKAFDSVPHRLLIHKLKSFGISGRLLAWFNSYLTNRKQKVTVEGEESEICDVLSGVPQGSILGPLLFLMYINDLPDVVNKTCKVALFADDAKVFREIKNINDAQDLQLQLDNIIRWSVKWGMKFNATKCKVISFTRKLNAIVYDYSMLGRILDKVDNINDLGITVTSNMSWNTHILNSVKKANRNLWMIKRCLGFNAPLKTIKILYTALVRSRLEYGSVVWSTQSKHYLETIEGVQRRATRYMCHGVDLDYKHRLVECKLLPLSYRREVIDCIFLHKLTSDQAAAPIFTFRDYPRNTRAAADQYALKPMNAHTETMMHFYSHRIVSIWNSLPSNIRNIQYRPKGCKFKRLINKFYNEKIQLRFITDNSCTWVTKCRCPRCRPV
jgi:hypothetical protein